MNHHTRGPWHIRRMYTGQIYVSNHKLPICHVEWVLNDSEPNAREANARLIAAAPNLLYALRLMLREHDALQLADGKTEDRWPAAAIARRAIFQATGA